MGSALSTILYLETSLVSAETSLFTCVDMDPITPARASSGSSFPIRRRRPKKSRSSFGAPLQPKNIEALPPSVPPAEPPSSAKAKRKCASIELPAPHSPASSAGPAPSAPSPAKPASGPAPSAPSPAKPASLRKVSSYAAASPAKPASLRKSLNPAAVSPATAESVRHASENVPLKCLKEPECGVPAQIRLPRPALTAPTSKRRKPSSKAYAAVPMDVPQEQRFRILVETFLQAAHATSAMARPAPKEAELTALETAVVEGVEVAGAGERGPESESIACKKRKCLDEPRLFQRAEMLDYIVRQYADELRQWESLERDLPALALGCSGEEGQHADGVAMMPPMPPLDMLLDSDSLENPPPIVDAVESFVLHTDAVNCSLKRLEAQHRYAANVVESITKTINASVFDGGLLNLNASKIAPSPRPRQ